MTGQCKDRKCIDNMNYQTENFLSIIKYGLKRASLIQTPKLQEPVDWDVLSNIAKQHNLLALFHEFAYKFSEYEQNFNHSINTTHSINIVAQQVKKTDMFLNVYRAFLEEDLHPIVMKGIVCRQMYGEYAEHRPSGDEDILVKKEEFHKIKAVLERLGFVCAQPDVTRAQLDKIQDVGFYEKSTRFLIEVHINLMGNRNHMCIQMGNSFHEVFENVQIIKVKDVPITTMSYTEHYLFLVLHAFKHFAQNGVGIRQMLDVLLYQEKYEQQIEWKWIRKELEKNSATTYLGDLQYIGIKYLELNLNILFETCSPEVLLEDMMEIGVFGRQEQADKVALSITLSSFDYKGKAVVRWIRTCFPSKKQMLEATPYLLEKPWMLPVEWLKRWGRFLKRLKKYDGNLVAESVKKSKKREFLLKKYGL